MTEPYRVVFDTNVFISAALSKSLTSPTRELLARWERKALPFLWTVRGDQPPEADAKST